MQSSKSTHVLALCISVLLLWACGDPAEEPTLESCGVTGAEAATPQACGVDACQDQPACVTLGEDVAPPTIEFLSSSTTNRTRYLLEGRITDAHRIASAMIRVGEERFEPLELTGPFDQKMFARRIELDEGPTRVYVRAADIAGNSNEAQFDVTMTPPVDDTLRADFSVPDDGRAGEPVTFDASPTIAPPNSQLVFRWDFGDGEAGFGRRAAHIYDRADDYVVELVVADAVSGRSSRHLDVASISPGSSSEARSLTVAAEVVSGADPVADATVLVDGSVVGMTDATGVVQFDAIAADALVLSVMADGYARAHKQVPVADGVERVWVRVELKALDTQTAADDPDGGIVFAAEGAELRATPGGLVTGTGAPAGANAQVSIAAPDPCADAAVIPDAPAFDLDGRQVTLDVRGGAFVDLGGLAISSSPDASVTVTLLLCDVAGLDDDEVQAWSLSSSGVWVEQQSASIVATPDGQAARFEITRGGWWAVGPAHADLHAVDFACSVSTAGTPASTACSLRISARDGTFRATRFLPASGATLQLPPGAMSLEAVTSDGSCGGTTVADIPEQTSVSIGLDCYGDDFEPLVIDGEFSEFTVAEAETRRGFRVEGQRGDGLIVDLTYGWGAVTGEVRVLDGQRRVLTAQPIDGRFEDGAGYALPFDGTYFIEVELASGFDKKVEIRARNVPVIDYKSSYTGNYPEGVNQVDHLVWVDPQKRALNIFQSGQLYGIVPRFVDYSDNMLDGRSASYPSNGPPPGHESGVIELPEGGFWIVRLWNHPISGLGPGNYTIDVVPVPDSPPLQFDAFGRATHDDLIDRIGEHHMYAFDGAAGDGIEASVVGLGGDALERAYDIGLRLWRVGNGTERGPEEMLHEFRLYPHGFAEHLDIFSARLPADDRYVLEVYHYRLHDLVVELGAYTLTVDKVAALDRIVVDDDVACTGANTRSVLAAGRAAPVGGVVEVCAGEYNVDVPLEILADGVSFVGAGRDNTLIRRKRTIYGTRLQQTAVNTRGDGVRIADLAVHARAPWPRSTSTAILIYAWGENTTLENLRVRTEEANRNFGVSTAGAQRSSLTVRGTSFENLAWGADINAGTVLFEDNTLDVRETGVRIQRGIDVVVRGNAQASGEICIDSYTTDSVQRFIVESNACTVDGYNVRGMSIQLDLRSDAPGRELVFRGNHVTAIGPHAQGIHLMPFGPYADVLVEGNRLEAPARYALTLGSTSRGTFGRVRVHNNVFPNHSNEGAIEVVGANGFVGVDVLHNTFVANPGTSGVGVSFYTGYATSGPLPVTLRHNIFQGDGDDAVVDRRPATGPFTIDASENLLSSMSATPFGDFASTSTWNHTIADAMLLPDTYAPAAGSPAIDAVTCIPSVSTDYNGDPRPAGSACDFGAYER